MTEKVKSKRGFAVLPPDQQRAIASLGGRRAHETGAAHTFTAEEASRAGAIGGAKVSADRQHMADIGRIGGKMRAKNAMDEAKKEDKSG